jgi:stage V sporulation protein B
LQGSCRKSIPIPLRKILSYASGTALLAVLFTLLISIDLFAIKALEGVPEHVGFYTAANTLARAPLYVLLGIVLAILPSLSRAIGQQDDRLVKHYVNQSLRTHLLIYGLVAAVISGTAPETIQLLYSDTFAPAATPLAMLAVAFLFFSLINSLYNLLVAAGDTKRPLLGISLLTVMAGLLNVILIPKYGMTGAAAAALVTSITGVLAGSVVCVRRFGALISLRTGIKIATAACATLAVARLVPLQGAALPALYVLLVLVYAATLIGLREITCHDVTRILSAVGLRKSRATAETKDEVKLR